MTEIFVGLVHFQVFGEVKEGLEHFREISKIGRRYSGNNDNHDLKENVFIEKCGVL